VVIVDLDNSRLSRALTVTLDNSETLHVQFYAPNMDRMREHLARGDARLAVVIPAGFARELSVALTPGPEGVVAQHVQVIADATNALAASLTMSAASDAVNAFSARLVDDKGLVVPEFIDFRTNVRFNPTLDVRNSTIPSQLGFIIYQVTLAVAALGLARERELGTLEQLMVTPLRRHELAVGKGVPAMAIGLLNFAATWAVTLIIFDIPMNGSPLLLASLTLIFVTAVVGWGVVISAVSRSQQQAILLVFILAMVEMAFSGFLVPVRNMPPLFQAIARFSPLQYYLEIVRSVMIKGAGLDTLWPQVLALAGLALGMWLLALRVVARRVE
jgi:ABC-2 type transport system permease protein